mmetsp:Transcript_30444/g.73010  ORF Transcript_30444/g.73010 Transcript_30444/m.73010 type:complete len:80 (+) Transcript_30444:1172-1411(+)
MKLKHLPPTCHDGKHRTILQLVANRVLWNRVELGAWSRFPNKFVQLVSAQDVDSYNPIGVNANQLDGGEAHWRQRLSAG